MFYQNRTKKSANAYKPIIHLITLAILMMLTACAGNSAESMDTASFAEEMPAAQADLSDTMGEAEVPAAPSDGALANIDDATDNRHDNESRDAYPGTCAPCKPDNSGSIPHTLSGHCRSKEIEHLVYPMG